MPGGTPCLGKRSWPLCALLLIFHALLLSVSIRVQFPTRNEVAHLPAGLSHWDPGFYSVYKVNPPLWRMLAVLPVLPLQPKVDGISRPSDPAQRNERPTAFAFARDNEGDYWKMVQLSRIAGMLWSVLGGVLVYFLSKELFGDRAALLGLALWCFDPNVLGHAALLTPDMPVTVAGFAATYLFWKYLQKPAWERAFYCGLVLGIAQLSKFTAILLYFVWTFLWIAREISLRRLPPPNSERGCLLQSGAELLSIFFVSILVINLGYTFDGFLQPLKEYQFASKTLRGGPDDHEHVGNRFKGSWVGEIPVPLPVDYVQGIDLQRRDFDGKLASYLRGEVRLHGWWYYYLYAFMVKVPLGTITLIMWAAALTLCRRPKWMFFASNRVSQGSDGAQTVALTPNPVSRGSEGPGLLNHLFIWLPPLAIFAFVSSQTGFTDHFRYVLPIFPFLFVAVSRLGCYFQPLRWRMAVPVILVILLLGSSVFSSLSVFPHSLSYFNELAGGPENGYYHLINSNIDWGQDLWFLKDWVDEHPEARPLALAYHNFIDHRPITGMDFPQPPRDPPKNRARASPEALRSFGPSPGYFAVDTQNLKLGPYTYFEAFKPMAKAGYSIFIYHISPEEADAARREMGLPPLAVAKVP